MFLLIEINLAHSFFSFTYVKCSLDVIYQALSQCDLSGPSSCSIFQNHLLKDSQAYPFKHSFKAFLLSGELSLVCLFICFVCLCSMIDAHRVNAVSRSFEELEVEDSEQLPSG
jgi:hypothetical protein